VINDDKGVDQMGTLLHPTDFSTNSDEAFLVACSIARDKKAKLIVLHVVNPNECAPGDLDGDELDRESDLQKKIESQFDYLKSLTYDVLLTFQIKLGELLLTVIDVATHEQCEMIILAGRNQVEQHYQSFGCISEGLLRHAPCSVLVLRHFHAESVQELASECRCGTSSDAGHPEAAQNFTVERNW